MNGGELVVETLTRAGVRKIFGLHGAHIDTIFQACLDRNLPIIDTRHEAAAGHAAEGYARTTSEIGVALVTAGGGFTNAVTPLANAFLDRTPLVVITGSGPLNMAESNTLQTGFDQVAVARPITKWAFQITQTDQIPRLLAQAIRIANSAPRGPVLIDIPWDVMTGTVADEAAQFDGHALDFAQSAPTQQEISTILSALNRAERPVIIVGSEALRGKAGAPLARFVAAAGIPCFADYEALAVLNDIGDAGMGLVQNLGGFREAGLEPDLVLMIGCRFGLNSGHGTGLLIPLDAKVIQIDPDARELGRLQKIDRGIVADAATTLGVLAEAAEAASLPDRTAWRTRIRARLTERLETMMAEATPTSPMHPLHASKILCDVLSDDVGLVADGALTYLWLSDALGFRKPAIHLCHGYLGCMGVGFGTAVGAQTALAEIGKRAILVTGDGSVGYGFAEFDTLTRHGLPLIVVIMNNRSWGATLQFQQMVAGDNRVTNTLLENGDYHMAAAAFGADPYYVETEAEFAAALGQALANDRPACINVRVDVTPVPPAVQLLGV